jgi:hypothetical protein
LTDLDSGHLISMKLLHLAGNSRTLLACLMFVHKSRAHSLADIFSHLKVPQK